METASPIITHSHPSWLVSISLKISITEILLNIFHSNEINGPLISKHTSQLYWCHNLHLNSKIRESTKGGLRYELMELGTINLSLFMYSISLGERHQGYFCAVREG